MDEPVNISIYANKPKQPSISGNKCIFCTSRFQKRFDKTELSQSKCDSLLALCKTRDDDISAYFSSNGNRIRTGEIKVFYHKACRAKFVHPFYNSQKTSCQHTEYESDADLQTPSKSTRSHFGNTSSGFEWKENCFICGLKCSSKHRSKWSMIEGSVDDRSMLYSKLLDISRDMNDHALHSRLLSTNGDLVAAEARYHRQPQHCLSKYLLQTRLTVCEKSQLERNCEILKTKLQHKIEAEKYVYDFNTLRANLAEISNDNGIDIPQSMLRTYRVKEALEVVWPDLKFIAREGLTYLVCSKNLTVDEALAKHVELHRSLQDKTEFQEIETGLTNSYVDCEDSDTSVLHAAASILRNRVKNLVGVQQEYFSSSEMNLEAQKNFLDPLLIQFVTWLGPDSNSYDAAIDEIDQKTISLCSDITTYIKPMMTPKHLGLSIYLHHSFGSKKLIENLHSHGYTLSYTEVRHFLTSAALYMASIQNRTLSGGVVPTRMSQDVKERAESLIVAAAHNWDHNENTLSGKRSTHAMTSILVHTPSSGQQHLPRIPRVNQRSIDTVQLPGEGLSFTLEYRKPTERPNPRFTTPVKMSELRPVKPSDVKEMEIYEILYTLGRSEYLFPPWTVFSISNIQ